jgi:hypothetical protein
MDPFIFYVQFIFYIENKWKMNGFFYSFQQAILTGSENQMSKGGSSPEAKGKQINKN